MLRSRGKRPGSVDDFRAERTIAGDRPPRYGMQGRFPFTVGRGPVPRHATIERETAWVCVQFSRRANDRGGQAPALRYPRPPPFHRRARACPSPCRDRGNGFSLRAVFAQIGRSRGTGPRATGPERGSPRHAPFGIRRARTTGSCSYLANLVNLVNPALGAWLGEGQALALRDGRRFFTGARGAVIALLNDL